MKNADGLARALLWLRANNWRRPLVVDWFGATHPAETESQARTQRFVEENGLADTLRFHDATRSIDAEIRRADAIGLFSHFEGLANVICEAMACGKPILLSDVCDAGNLVEDGKNGFLCDPSTTESIATAIIRMATLEESRRREMGLASRRKAEQLFAESTVLERYELCLRAVARQERVPPGSTHPARVPESAARFVEAWAAAGPRRYGH
jgi:glycosyltransferase involved in cell wall biosynthesis